MTHYFENPKPVLEMLHKLLSTTFWPLQRRSGVGVSDVFSGLTVEAPVRVKIEDFSVAPTDKSFDLDNFDTTNLALCNQFQGLSVKSKLRSCLRVTEVVPKSNSIAGVVLRPEPEFSAAHPVMMPCPRHRDRTSLELYGDASVSFAVDKKISKRVLCGEVFENSKDLPIRTDDEKMKQSKHRTNKRKFRFALKAQRINQRNHRLGVYDKPIQQRARTTGFAHRNKWTTETIVFKKMDAPSMLRVEGKSVRNDNPEKTSDYWEAGKRRREAMNPNDVDPTVLLEGCSPLQSPDQCPIDPYAIDYLDREVAEIEYEDKSMRYRLDVYAKERHNPDDPDDLDDLEDLKTRQNTWYNSTALHFKPESQPEPDDIQLPPTVTHRRRRSPSKSAEPEPPTLEPKPKSQSKSRKAAAKRTEPPRRSPRLAARPRVNYKV
ncbi:hypothetical protein DFJ77DRAFT_443269 [Powellomyces hirtus]|nr:hypothetical protein DFJ77DRAFT_443269 [Powellomyces hirtus]